jgi:phosphate transport system protein
MQSAVRFELTALTSQLAEMCGMAADAIDQATHALLLADREMAQAVIAGYENASAMRSTTEETTFHLLAAQPPLAADLRSMVNAIRITADAERMGALSVQVAEIACRHHPYHAVPAEVGGRVAELSALAVALARADQEALLSRERRLTALLRRDTGAVGELYRQLLSVLIDPRWRYGVAAGVDVALLSRLYERFADHAVQIAGRVDFEIDGDPSRANPAEITASRLDL